MKNRQQILQIIVDNNLWQHLIGKIINLAIGTKFQLSYREWWPPTITAAIECRKIFPTLFLSSLHFQEILAKKCESCLEGSWDPLFLADIV